MDIKISGYDKDLYMQISYALVLDTLYFGMSSCSKLNEIVS